MMNPPSKFSIVQKFIAFSLIGACVFTTALVPLTAFAQLAPIVLPPTMAQPPAAGDLYGNGYYGEIPINATGVPLNVEPTEENLANPNTEIEDKQAEAVQSGGTTKSSQTTQAPITDLAKEGLSCSAATILGQVISSAISAALTEIIGSVIKDEVKKQVEGVVENPVPTKEVDKLLDTQKRSLDYQKLTTHSEKGVPGPFGIYINVSWDSIAWCVVNAMIEYIANATIAWANSGFNGNPAFLENPERFFRDLADYQAGTIIKDIAYGASGGKVNVCAPFRVTIAIGLAQSYPGYGQNALNSRYQGMSCRLSDISQQKIFGGITAGAASGSQGSAVSWTEWGQLTQNDENNPIGSYILANQALYSTVEAKNNELRLEIGMNNGWLNFKKCPDGEKDLTKCNTVTPGTLIQSSLEKTLNLPKDRLVLAQKFDQMITAIVNNLIKIALDKVLEEAKE